MAEISFTGNKKLKSINNEWCGKFPYLYLSFFTPDGKVAGDWEVTHASIRGAKGAKELSTTASMNVGTFEKRYEDTYGARVEIKYIKNGRKYSKLGDHDKLSLAKMNAWAKDNGGSEIKEAKPQWF